MSNSRRSASSRRSRAHRASPVRPLDQLEARILFSITTYTDGIPTGSAIAADNAGNLYLTSGDGLLKFSKQSDGTLSSFTVLATGDFPPSDVVFNNVDGKLYFAFNGGIGDVGTDGSGLALYDVKDPGNNHFENIDTLAVAADGSVWFGTSQDPAGDPSDYTLGSSLIGRLTTGGSLHVEDIPLGHQSVSFLAPASDGSVWAVEQGATDGVNFNETFLAHVTVSSGGTFAYTSTAVPTSDMLPGSTPDAFVGGLAVAQDGSLWITNNGGTPFSGVPTDRLDALNHVTFASDGTATFTPVVITKDAGEGNTTPGPLSIDSTGKLWFIETEYDADSGAPVGTRLSSYNPSSHVFDRETIAGATVGSIFPVAFVNGANGPTDVWTATADGTLADQSIPQATTSFTVTGRSVTGTEDVALAATVAGVNTPVVGTFSGPAGTYSVSIAWSDGTSSAGRIVTGTDGNQYIALATGVSKTFATQGLYSATISVSNGVTTQTASSSVSIGAAIVASQGVTVTPVLGRLVLSVTTTFTSAVSEPASAFKATIAWGDGTTTTGVIVRNPFNPSQYYVIGLHSYRVTGNYTITTTINNVSLSETATGTAFIHV